MYAVRHPIAALSICLALAVLGIVAAAVLLAYPPALAQGVKDKEISGLRLDSPEPGKLVITWDAASPTPEDHRVIWAKSDEKFKKWNDFSGNAFPTGTSHTVEGLEEGTEYKVKVRARYEGEEAGPWSDPVVRLTISSTPDLTPEPTTAPTPQPTAEPTSEPTEEPTPQSATAPTPEPSVSETEGADLPMTTATTGRLAMGGSVTGRVASRYDQDWYAVELVQGHAYVVDQRGESSGGGTMVDPFLMGLYDAQGSVISGTRSPDGGVGIDSRLYYLATGAGRHYVSAAGNGEEPTGTGTYTLSIRDLTVGDADATSSGATAWGEIVDQSSELEVSGRIGADDRADYFSFTLSAEREVQLSLRDLESDADLYLEDDAGAVLLRGRKSGRSEEKLTPKLGAGTYYVRVIAKAGSAGDYALAYRTLPLLPTAPSAVGATATHNQVSLTWLALTDERVSGYQVLRGADAASLVETGTTDSRDATSYTDTTVQPETNYVYGVKARNRHGLSEAIMVSIATEAAPAPATVDDASLSALSLSDVFLDFDPTVYEYRVDVPNAISHTTLTVTTSHEDATYTIDRADADPGTEGHQFRVRAVYWVTITVTAADGQTTRDYRIRIWDTGLRSIILANIPFVFKRTTTDYNVKAHNFLAETTVSVTEKINNRSNVAITPADSNPDRSGHQVALEEGSNTITVTVSDKPGVDSETYTVVVVVPAPGTTDFTQYRTTMELPGSCELEDVGRLTHGGYLYTPSYAARQALFTHTDECYALNDYVNTVYGMMTTFVRFFVPERGRVSMAAQGHSLVAIQYMFLYSADGTALATFTHRDLSSLNNEPDMSVTLDPGVYILKISSERRDCWRGQCYRIAAFFSGNVLSMADLPSQDVLNNFEVKQLTVGATGLDSVRDLFHEVSVASTETQVTIAALPVADVDSIVITPGDADTGTAGHQISLGGTGPQYVHVTVLDPEGTPQRTHLIKISR